MRVRCINRPLGSMCPAYVDVPAGHREIAVAVPDPPALVPAPNTTEVTTDAYRVGTVPIRKVPGLYGYQWVADFHEMTVS